MPQDLPSPPPDLNPKQAKFCELYAVSNIGSEAYRQAYGCKSDGAAKVGASRLLDNPTIQGYVDALREAHKNRLDFDGMRVLKELGAIALANPKEMVRIALEGLSLQNIDDVPDEFWPCVAGVKITPTEFGDRVELSFHNKLTALGKLARYFAVDMNPNELISQVRALGYSVTDEFAEGEDSPPPPVDDGEV